MAENTGDPPTPTGDPRPTLEELVDRISDLPEPLLVNILSLLPTHRAAQTSLLSRRFRNLWSACPSIYFDRSSFGQTPKFLKMLEGALRGRDRSAPVERIRIESSHDSRCLLPVESVGRWIVYADFLGVRHLNLRLEEETNVSISYFVFSLKSLESIHISTMDFEGQRPMIPKNIRCTRLKSLCMWLNVDSADLTSLVSGLPVLELLELHGIDQDILEISSQSVKTLKLFCKARKMKLLFPILDYLYLHCKLSSFEVYQGEMPSVRKAEFTLNSPVEKSEFVVVSMLKSVANAVELCLSLETRMQFEKTYLKCCEIPLTMHRLERLKFSSSACYLKLFQAEMPVLRKADITLNDARQDFVLPMRDLLKCVEEVVELKLYIRDHRAQLKPFHIWVPNKIPQFPRLVNFELSVCCHESTIEDVISLLENSPVLNNLKMRHEDPCIEWNQNKKRTFWQSKLPQNSEGNYQHACFTDFGTRDEKSQVIKMLSRRLASKKRKNSWNEYDQFHPLVEPGKEIITFPNLRSLRLSMCFYEKALQDLICLFRHSPVIDCLHLTHVDGPSHYYVKPWPPEVWHSKLPQNSEGDRKYADFTNLNSIDKKSEAIKLLSRENPSKRLKTSYP